MISLYVIRNKANNKVYIGQTVQTLNNRLNGHSQDSRFGSQMAVHCALRKYGPDVFEIIALCAADDQGQANRLEKAFILVTRANKGRGYNMTDGGKDAWVCTEEARARMRARITPEERRRRSERMKGKVFSTRTRCRIAESTRVRGKKEYAQNPDRLRTILAKGWCGLKTPLPGEKNGRAKITATEVQKIREICKEGQLSQEQIGQQFGITQMMVSRIVTRKAWKHIP